jgi:hypothetical protein
LVIIASAVATVIYVAGFIRGVKNAFNGYRQAPDDDAPVSQEGHWLAIAVALTFSVVSIAGMGYSPVFIYISLFSVIVTTFGVGTAFFIEKKIPPAPRGPR